MNLYCFVSCLILASFIAGCASNPRIDNLSSNDRAKVSKVEIFRGQPNRPFQNLGQVDGLSCNRNKFQAQDVSESEALEGIKIRTVMLGGDAAINVLCQKNSDMDLLNNCWASVKCIGDAVLLK